MASLLVIYMGGTIGMKKDMLAGDSLRPAKGYLSEFLNTDKDLRRQLGDRVKDISVIEHDPLLDSSDMHPSDWLMIAKMIKKYYHQYQGFLVLQGTDTMAYVASATSFLLKNLRKPVIFTGSMLPISAGYTSDAMKNLFYGLYFASSPIIKEVCIYFGSKLLRANRAKKVDAGSLEAFDSPNFLPLAECGVDITENTSLIKSAHKYSDPYLEIDCYDKIDNRILVVFLVPGYADTILEKIAETDTNELRAIVLVLYGSGNAPSIKEGKVSAVRESIKEGKMVFIATQCLRGKVDLKTYATGRRLLDEGCISLGDATIEASVTKLGVLLGNFESNDDILKMMAMDLRGELSVNTSKL